MNFKSDFQHLKVVLLNDHRRLRLSRKIEEDKPLRESPQFVNCFISNSRRALSFNISKFVSENKTFIEISYRV